MTTDRRLNSSARPFTDWMRWASYSVSLTWEGRVVASPAEAVRAAIVAAELAMYPAIKQVPYDTTVQCFVTEDADEPNQALLCQDAVGLNFGRVQRTQQTVTHPGVKLTMRSLDSAEGYDIIQSVVALFDALKYPQTYNIRDKSVQVFSIYPVGTLTFLGEEQGTRRLTWVQNVRVVMGQTSLGV
jgi:hypothetical protein